MLSWCKWTQSSYTDMYQLIFWHSVYCRIILDQQKKARWLPNKLHFNGKNKRYAPNMHSYKACLNQKSARVLGMKSKCCICCFVNRGLTLDIPCILSFVVLAVQCLIFLKWLKFTEQTELSFSVVLQTFKNWEMIDMQQQQWRSKATF